MFPLGIHVAVNGLDLREQRSDALRLIGKEVASPPGELCRLLGYIQAEAVIHVAMEDAAPGNSIFHAERSQQLAYRTSDLSLPYR
jgi:hypothetical protein